MQARKQYTYLHNTIICLSERANQTVCGGNRTVRLTFGLSPLHMLNSTISIIYMTHVDIISRIGQKRKVVLRPCTPANSISDEKIIFLLFFSILVLKQLRISHDLWLVSHARCLENNMGGIPTQFAGHAYMDTCG